MGAINPKRIVEAKFLFLFSILDNKENLAHTILSEFIASKLALDVGTNNLSGVIPCGMHASG